MTQTTLSHSLTFMFKDEDWFWKVLLGALALLLVAAGIGYFFVIGYHVETVRRCRKHEPALPDWNPLSPLWRSGLRVGSAMLCYSALASACLAAVHLTGVFAIAMGIVVTHTIVLPFVILSFLQGESLKSCFALHAVFCFGWMALIVGWPFFIFWGMLATAAFTASLAPALESTEAVSR
jgi:Protein of unknown function (DUF4013)